MPDKVTDPVLCSLVRSSSPSVNGQREPGKGEGLRGSLQKKAAGIHLLGICQEGGPGSRTSAGLCYTALQTCFLVCDHMRQSPQQSLKISQQRWTLSLERRPASRSPKPGAVDMQIRKAPSHLWVRRAVWPGCVCVSECVHTCTCRGP